MPTCAAQSCGARSDRGDVLRVFPRKDLQRRQIWIDRVNRPGWSPTKHSALCELHFDKDQWELPREDGKRKLKSNALPSIFCVEHPSNHDVVATDHAYSIPRLRKLFDDTDSDEGSEPTMPIEHIKIEADENDNLTPEYFEVDTEDEQVEKVLESIQCTPDIFLYSEHVEPEPMEVVHCEEVFPSISINDPSNDPLAISADDVVKSNGVVPNFPHCTKYLFVPNQRAIIATAAVEVQGEPEVVNTPKIKVRSADSLLKPTSATLDATPAKSEVNITNALVQLLPQVGPSDKVQSTSPAKSGLYRNPIKLDAIPPSKPQTNPLCKITTKKCLIKIDDSAQLYFNKNQAKTTVGAIDSSSTCQNQKDPTFSKPQKFIHKNGKKSMLEMALQDVIPFESKQFTLVQNITKTKKGNGILTLVNNSVLDNKRRDQTKKLKSIKSYARIENIYLEHLYSKKVTWRPLTLNGLKLNTAANILKSKPSNRRKYSHPNQPDCHQSNETMENNAHTLEESLQKKLPLLLPKNNVATGPVNASTLVSNSFTLSPEGVEYCTYKLPTFKKKRYELYDCSICNISFLTLATLEIHMEKHRQQSSQAVGGDQFKRDAENNSKANILDHRENVDKSPGKKNLQRVTHQRNTGKSCPYKFENSIVSIPNLFALRKLTKNKLYSINRNVDKEYNYSENFVSRKGRRCKKTRKLIAEDDISTNMKSKIENPSRLTSSRNELSQMDAEKILDNVQPEALQTLTMSENTDLQKDLALTRQPIVLIPKLDLSTIFSRKVNNLSNSNNSNITKIKSSDEEIVKNEKNINVVNYVPNNNVVNKDAEPRISLPIMKNVKIVLNDIKKSALVHTMKNESKIQSGNKIIDDITNGDIKCQTKNITKPKGSVNNVYNIRTKPTSISTTANKTVKNKIENHYKCKLCHKRFLKSFKLRRHVTINHKAKKPKPFRCYQNSCGCTFETKRELNKHCQTHRKSSFIKQKKLT